MVALPDRPQPTVEAIYAAREAAREDGRRAHLGASQLGHKCERALWYGFRWATIVKHTGRMLRLFERGQLEEARFVAELRSIGVTVWEVDEAGRQFSLRDPVTGHIGGSMDGVGIGFTESKQAHVLEFKTHGAKSFADLKAKGVDASKPMHAAQMQIYMELADIDRAFYLAVDKNTDELYQERLHRDRVAGARLLAKGERVVRSAVPPPRMTDDPSWFECRFCDHHAVCHEKAPVPRNCRTCLHSTPADGGKWTCERWNIEPDIDRQKAGCEMHLFIPALVHGEQVDAGDGWVKYRMADGTDWSDQECPF